MLERFRRAIAPRPVDRGAAPGLPWDAIYPPPTLSPYGNVAAYPAPRSVAASTSSQLLAAANPARAMLAITNDGTANLYVITGRFAATSLFTTKLGPGQTMVLEPPNVYQGDVAGVWDVANGFARITETT